MKFKLFVESKTFKTFTVNNIKFKKSQHIFDARSNNGIPRDAGLSKTKYENIVKWLIGKGITFKKRTNVYWSFNTKHNGIVFSEINNNIVTIITAILKQKAQVFKNVEFINITKEYNLEYKEIK